MTDILAQRFQVDYRFDVAFTRDAFAGDNDTLANLMEADPARPARALVWLDQAVVTAFPDLPRRIHAWFACQRSRGVALAADPLVIPGGEAAKSDFGLVERVARTCVEVGLCRHSYIIIIGGGAVLDAVGFAASLVHRGIRQIRLPTTTLSQADGGLGVKNAINAFGQKNLLGTFTPPRAILNDARFLTALDDRGWRDGVAEAVKVAAIKDAAFARELADLAPRVAARDAVALERVIRRTAELHLAHITGSGDPFEQGSSRPLDFGHWSAHRLEILSNHRLSHGEAVAIGVALDLLYAADAGMIAGADADLLITALHGAGFRLWDEVLELTDGRGRRSVLAGLDHFREHLGGVLTLAMPDGLGRQQDTLSLDEERYLVACSQLRRRYRRNPENAIPSFQGA